MTEPQGETVSFAARLARLRDERGLNQKQLAGRVGCRPSMISRLERGVRSPRVDLLVALSKTLGIGVDDLLGVPRREKPDASQLLVARLREILARLGPAQVSALVAILSTLLALVKAAPAARRLRGPGGAA